MALDYDAYLMSQYGPDLDGEADQTDTDEEDTPMLVQCTARESGGVRCEVMLTSPEQEHHHWISDETIRRKLR